MEEEKNWTGNITLSVTLEVTEENIDDIMVTAIEGGIGYWCSECNKIGDLTYGDPEKAPLARSVHLARGGKLELFVSEPFEEYKNGKDKERYVLTREKLLKGIRRVIEARGVDSFYFNGEMDCCNVDAEVADIMVQYALFGDIIYG